MLDPFIGGHYRLVKKLGQGAYGEVYLGVHQLNKAYVAIKIQNLQNKTFQLFQEAKVLIDLAGKHIQADNGIPHVYYCGNQGQFNAMVMDLYGQSLEQLFVNNGKRFDLKTTLMVGLQIIEIVQYIHSRGYIHRDLKPENFVLGKGDKAYRVYIIDFGTAKKYLEKIEKKKTHIPYKDTKNLVGTARYTSINTHLGIQQGRRDDIESIVYVLVYFLKGHLPWQNLHIANKKEKYQKVLDMKLQTPINKLCSGTPEQFQQMLTYCRNLEFQQQPDYDYLKGLFIKIMNREKIQMDYKYCWLKTVQLI